MSIISELYFYGTSDLMTRDLSETAAMECHLQLYFEDLDRRSDLNDKLLLRFDRVVTKGVLCNRFLPEEGFKPSI